MKRLVSLHLLVTLTAVLAVAQSTRNAAPSPRKETAPASKPQFFPVEQVKPGMRAVGYTVFEGSEPKPFEVEILGVLKMSSPYSPNHDRVSCPWKVTILLKSVKKFHLQIGKGTLANANTCVIRTGEVSTYQNEPFCRLLERLAPE